MAGFGIGGNADFGRIAQEEGVPANLLPLAESIYQQETHSGQNVATSPRGAVGPMQVTPATFQDYHPNGDIHNPADNIRAGLRKIKSDSEFFNGDPSLTAAAYHAGRQAVVNAGNAVPDTNDGSISTADYADAVTQRLPTQPQPLPEPAKPPTWDEVRNDPRLKDAAPEVIEGARKQYFNRLILPKLQPDEIDGAWKRFDELTNPSMTASAKRTIGNAMDATTGAVSSAAKATYGAAGDAAKGVGMAITDAAKKVGGGNAVQARENPVTPEDVSIDEGGYHAPADMTARTEVKIPGSVMTVPTIEVAPHVDQRAMDAGLGPIDTDAMNLRVRRTLEAATPEEREAFAQRPDYIGQLAKDQLASWQKHDVQAAQLPALQGMTERWEDRAAQLQKQGMSKVDAEREAKAQATLAIPPHSEGSITPSDLDFEGQKGAKRVWNDWQSGMVGTTGGILSYVARKSGMGSAEDIGDAMSHWAEKKMPAEPTFSDKMVSNIAGMTNFYLGGVGVRTGTEALSMLGPVLAKWAGAAGDAGLMAASSANEVYHGALGQGLSEKEAAARADKAFAANALLFTGANRLGFFNDLTKLGEKVTAAAATNAPLMATQQVIQNYFLDRPLDEGVGEAALMGATAGAAVVGAHHLAGKLPVPAEKPAPVHIEPGLATEPAVGGKAEPAMGNVEVAASNEPAMGATPEVKGAKEPVLGAEPTLTESTKTPAIAKYEPVAGEPPPWEIPRKAFYADKQRPITTPMPLYATADPHKFLVEQALESGEPVPKDVLADYPALAAKYPQKEEPVATEPKKQSSETPETPEIVKPEPVTASRLEALAQAGKLSRSTGTPHEVIQNPNEPGKWLVQPKEEARTEEAPQSQLVKEYAQLKQREAAAKSLAEVGLPVTKQNTADHDAVKSAAAVDESKVDQLGIQYPTDEVAFMAGIRGIIDGNAGTETHKGGETIAGAGAKSGALRGREVSPLPAGKAEESGAVQTDRKNPNESLRTGDAKAEAGTAGATTGEVKPKSKLAQEYEAAKAKDRPAIVTQTPAQAGVSTPAGREVERFAGMYNKGLTAFNAKRVVKERSAEKPGLDWRAEPAPEHGPDRFVVVGREKPTPVDEAAREAATSPTNALPEPTEAQKKAGNYAKGHVNIGGLNISIENPEGSTRSGTDKNGKPWSVEFKGAHYGYIRRTEGGDGEQVDAYVKAGTPEDYNGPVFVIDQKKPGNGHFDEHKAMIGYSDEAAARAGYQENYDKNWDGIRAITPMSFDEFKTWLKEGDTTRPANEAGDAKQAPAFSRNRGVPVEDLNAIVQGIRARWKGAPRIHPLFEHDEAPQSLQDEIAKSGGPRDHAGAFHNGEIYLFGKYMADDAHGQRVAVHELTHYGLEGLLGDDLGPVMMRIWKDHPGVQLEASRLMNRYHYSRVTAVNEVLANMGGKGERPSWWQKLTAAVRDSLRRYGFNLKMNDADVTSLVDRALQYSRKPKSDVTHLYRTHYSQPNPVWYSQMGRQIADKGSTAIPAELKAREEAAKKAEAEKAKEPPGKKVTADQVDLFNPQGSLFSRAETPDEKLAKEYARAKAAEPTEPMPRGKLAREYTLTKDAHKAGALFSRADALGEVEAQSKDNWLKAHYLKAAKSVINFTDRLANPLVDLPGERDYLKHRQVAMGVIGSGNDVVKEIRNVFHEATPEDRQAAFDYFTTEGASPASIKDEKVRSGVQTIKDAINHVSDQLVDKGVINAESREEFRDRYLPQLYLRHLLEDNAWKIGGSGKKTSDMGYTKGRKLEQFRNAEGEVRLRDKATGKELSDQEVLKLGPVTDPEYLASVALARPMRDMAILDWLESISKDERWVLPNTTMKWNGKNVSPYFLKTEADRLRRQANYYEPEAGKRATGYADKMDAAANKALENLPTDSKGFTQIPNSGRYGAMRGIWVRSEVYHDLVGNAHFQPNDMNWFQNLFGVGGVGTKVTQMWKGTKTYLNPSGQVRNFVTNMTQLQLSGVPFHSLPSLMIKTIGEMRNKGPHFQEFKAQGGETGTFANEDLGRMQRELLDMQHRDGELSTWGQLHRAAAIVTNKAGDVWQANEVLGKLMKFIHERERGASPGNAMIEANKTLFDYSLVQPWIRYARSVPYGIPFATWNAKVLPRLTETALLHPQRYLPYVAAFYGAQYALASVLGVTYDDLDKLRKAMPQWLWDHHNAMLMPWKDAKGRWQVMDLSYFMPWQQWGQLANDTVHGDVSKSLQDIGAFGGPIPNIISAISTQQDPFTHRDIAHKGDPPMQQAASWLNYAWTLAAPPFLTDSGALGHAIRAYTGTTNKYGDPLDTPTQSLLRPFGINLYALTPEQTQMANVQRMKHDVNDSERELKTQLLDRSLSPEQRDTIRNRYLDEIQRREGKINQYLEDSKIAPALRTGH